VVNEGHWALASAIEPGLVHDVSGSDAVCLEGKVHEALVERTARVDWATGELPWEVAIGDLSHMREYAGGLSKEWTDNNVAWSRTVPMMPDDIGKAFGKRSIPRPRR
jgi:hypothetical protein